jgi:alpha/beta hydrolase fold
MASNSTQNGNSASGKEWQDLPKALGGQKTIDKLNELFAKDGQYQAFTTTNAITSPTTFGIKSAGGNDCILVTVENGKGRASIGNQNDAKFTLSALPLQWEQFFKPVPTRPYQSYWGMFGMNIKQEGIEVIGDQNEFAHYTHVWRRTLELLHEVFTGGPMKEDPYEEPAEDHITGRYIFVEAPIWGKCKVFVETAGDGGQEIVFLHTAGSDGRQYHGVMNDPRTRKLCKMYAFDLPGHGRSFPSRAYHPGAHTNTEDSYVGCIAAVVKKLGLNKPIICGASMAGQVCLAVAIRHEEVGAGGTIPLQG